MAGRQRPPRHNNVGVNKMPLYEDKVNVENIIKISDEAKASVVFNTQTVIDKIAEIISGLNRPARIALDGW